MAYTENRNYAQEIADLIAGNGSAGTVQQLLNERIQKQQAMDTGYGVYDDTYRAAQDYIRAAGLAPRMDEGVNYAALANSILASGQSEEAYRQYLAEVLAGRQAKLDTGRYDEWAGSVEPVSGMPYNGAGSLAEALTPKRNTGYLTDPSTLPQTGVAPPAYTKQTEEERKAAHDAARESRRYTSRVMPKTYNTITGRTEPYPRQETTPGITIPDWLRRNTEAK